MKKPDATLRGSTNPVLALLRTEFQLFRNNLPLAIGIHRVIKERLPDIGIKKLRLAMKIHTSSTAYLKSLSGSEIRFDLDGNPAGEVTADQRKAALDTVRERFRKSAELHKAELQAKETQAKLVQLAAKFNARS